MCFPPSKKKKNEMHARDCRFLSERPREEGSGLFAVDPPGESDRNTVVSERLLWIFLPSFLLYVIALMRLPNGSGISVLSVASVRTSFNVPFSSRKLICYHGICRVCWFFVFIPIYSLLPKKTAGRWQSLFQL